jgi:putative FmdB family regulatory protein
MPIREYRCEKCGNVFENIEIDARSGKVRCPDCGTRKVRSLFSAFASSVSQKSSCSINRPST